MFPRRRGLLAPPLLLLPLLVMRCRAEAEPTFLSSTTTDTMTTTTTTTTTTTERSIVAGTFKGLPELPPVNETLGETRSVYYYDQIVAVVDIADGQKLLRCELVEVYEASEAKEILKNLSTSFRPHKISFKDIIKLMDNCDKLDENPARTLPISSTSTEQSKLGNPLLVGIIPGTKWCGTGDIAKSYSDLGSRTRIDRCCRAHDLCPVKIRAYRSRYNLTNNSFFTKSHCTCDETFYNCLKSINHVAANIIGNIYFNIAQPPCIDDEPTSSDKNNKSFICQLNASILCYLIE